ncbi:MAG: hypothetical protein WBL77_19610, partial [Pseudolabrys sp.]
VRKTPAMARHEGARVLERERGTKRTMVAPAISLALVLAGEIVENGDKLPRASINNMGDNTCLAAT